MRNRVLVVDDEPSILETTRYILESEGYDVLTACNGEQALSVLRRERPAVVLLDVTMPRLNGHEVCRALRRDPQLCHTHVIVLTAKGQTADEDLARQAGADCYWRKPFDDEEILAHLADFFAARERPRAASC